MIQNCAHENRSKCGKNRNGGQRWRCGSCGTTFTSSEPRPLGDMRTPLDKAAIALNMLLEGMSIRGASRITSMKVDTICDLVIEVGEKCEAFLLRTIKDVESTRIELDEIWGFVGCKQRTATKRGYTDGRGDSWTWLAIDANTKMILSYAVGQRDQATGIPFLARLNKATKGHCQVTADGLPVYRHNVPLEMGSRVVS